MSDDRLLRALQYLAMLLFFSAGVLPLARGQHRWAKWARWGSIAAFAAAFLFPRRIPRQRPGVAPSPIPF